MHDALFSPASLGDIELPNRVVMAPMTRSRSNAEAAATDLMLEYYRQRAGAGLIISEGIAPSADGLGYCRTPGLYNDAQQDSWAKVTAAVSAAGGRMVAQLMHVGRVASAHNKPASSETVAPSAITARGEMYTDAAGMVPFDAPRALSGDEIPEVINHYCDSAARAMAAGFAGVELHCTSGYLPAQFLSTGSNQRSDAYGGSLENRCRFVLETLRALAARVGAGRVGFRICPGNPFNDLRDDDPTQTFDYLLQHAADLDLAYLHVIRMPAGPVDNLALGQRWFPGRLIVNDSYTAAEAADTVAAGAAAAVSFARHFIANPDLPHRLQNDLPLARFNAATLYTPGPAGYTDY